MFWESLVGMGVAVLLGSVQGIGTCSREVSWQVSQAVGGTCPNQMQQQGGEAFDSIITNIIGSLGGGACLTTSTSSSASCSPKTLPFDDDFWQNEGRRLESDGCQQCSGSDDD
jgi:hypothetical protein